jgi:tetratricopeptide (TPR) repeat protein
MHANWEEKLDKYSCPIKFVIFSHESSFTKQILIFWKSKEYSKAHELSSEFVKMFPQSLMAHYMLAKCCMKLRDYNLALAEGHRAFNLAESEDDLIASGVFLSCVYYQLRRYSKSLEVLNALKDFGDEKVEKAFFIISLCVNDPTEAMMHVDALYRINKEVANDFVDKFLALARNIETAPS